MNTITINNVSVDISDLGDYANGDVVADICRKVYSGDTITLEEIEAVKDELEEAGINSRAVYGYDVELYDLPTLGEYTFINPENDQKTIRAIGDQYMANDDAIKMEKTYTTDYHDWSSDRAELEERIWNASSKSEVNALIDEYNTDHKDMPDGYIYKGTDVLINKEERKKLLNDYRQRQ